MKAANINLVEFFVNGQHRQSCHICHLWVSIQENVVLYVCDISIFII